MAVAPPMQSLPPSGRRGPLPTSGNDVHQAVRCLLGSATSPAQIRYLITGLTSEFEGQVEHIERDGMHWG